MIRTFFLILFTCLVLQVSGQLTLEGCRQKAQAHYPLARQYKLIELSESYSLANAAKGNLPQISLSGKASYQSDVTEIPFDIPELSIKGLPKDQYQIMLENKQNYGTADISGLRNNKFKHHPKKRKANWT